MKKKIYLIMAMLLLVPVVSYAQLGTGPFGGNTSSSSGGWVGTATSDLDMVDNSIELDSTTTSTTGIIFKDGSRFVHDFHHPTGDTAIPEGNNIFIGENAGNFTLGSTATSTFRGSRNIGIGSNSLDALTTGFQNVGIGAETLSDITTPWNNLAIGYDALKYLTTGGTNIGIGAEAGRFIADGTTHNETSGTSIYIGTASKASADGDTNEIVIGYNATGNGSNTVTIGNSSTVSNHFTGDIVTSGAGARITLDDTLIDGNDASTDGTITFCGVGNTNNSCGAVDFESVANAYTFKAANDDTTNALTVLSNGKVGIGNVTDPDVALEVNGSIKAYDNATVISTFESGSNDASLRVVKNSTSKIAGVYLLRDTSRSWRMFMPDSDAIGDGDDFAIGTSSASADFIIDDDTKFIGMGLGTAMPEEPLHVSGTIKTEPQASDTCDANAKGSMMYDSDDDHFYGCNGTSWIQLDN